MAPSSRFCGSPSAPALLLLSSLLFSADSRAGSDPYADRVASYQEGRGHAQGYTDPGSALGEPSRLNPDGPVNPFEPAWTPSQLVSVGEGGHLDLVFDPPLFDHPANPWGLDFVLHGNAYMANASTRPGDGFVADGVFGGFAEGQQRVLISEDGEQWHELIPLKASSAEEIYPTDPSGAWGIPVDPDLEPGDFSGAGLERLRELYGGSGGGTGFDLAWARDGEGDPVELDRARFLRLEVLFGKVEYDAVVSVSPSEPLPAVDISESFETDPLGGGWSRSVEDGSFQWDSSQERLRVEWDSSGPNRYFHLPLGQVVTRRRDLSWSFDLELESIEIGTTPGKEGTFPIALALLDLGKAREFSRGSGINEERGPRNVVEWSYFPDSGFGATVSSGLISADSQWAFQNTFPLELETGVLYRVEMDYRAGSGVLATAMTEDGEPFGPLQEARLEDIYGSPSRFTDLEVDVLAICNYHDGGQDPDYAGSVRAVGHVDNLRLSVGPAARTVDPISIRRGGADGAIVGFEARGGLSYWLEETRDLARWMTVDALHADGAGLASFALPALGEELGFYRVREGYR